MAEYYLTKLDIFYAVTRYSSFRDIISLLKCLPELDKDRVHIRINIPVDIRDLDNFYTATLEYPIFTNIHITDFWHRHRLDTWELITKKFGQIVRVLIVDSINVRQLDFEKFPRLHTLKLIYPEELHALYGLKRLQTFKIHFCTMPSVGAIFSQMPFFRRLHHLEMYESKAYDLLDVLPQMTQLKSFSYVVGRFAKFDFRPDIFRAALQVCPSLTDLSITIRYNYLRLSRLVVNLPRLQKLNLVIFYDYFQFDYERNGQYCKELSKLFGKHRCPDLRILNITLISKAGLDVRASWGPAPKSILLELAEEFPYITTLMLSNKYSTLLMYGLEETIVSRGVKNTIENLHINCTWIQDPYAVETGRVIITRYGKIRMHKSCSCDDDHKDLFQLIIRIFPKLKNLYIVVPKNLDYPIWPFYFK